jgi:AraC-like DNA-binding protein
MEILLLFIAAISIVLSMVTVKYAFNGEINFSNICLSGFLFIMGLYGIAHYIINYSHNVNLIANVLNIYTPLFVTIGPFLYLYTKKTLSDKINGFSIQDALVLLIPFIIFTIDLSPHLISSFNEKIEIANDLVKNTGQYKGTRHLLFSDSTSTIIRTSINFIFILFSFVNLVKTKIISPLSEKQSKIMLNFLYFLNISNLIFTLLMLFYLAIVLKYFINSEGISQLVYNVSWIFHGIIIMIIFFFPSILYNIPQGEQYIEKKIISESEKKKYKHYSLEIDYIVIIKDKLEYFLETKKMGEDFKLSTLTFETKIPIHHLNLYFKEELKTSFSTWKHKHKLKYALELINEGSFNNLTIEAIAMKSGFQTYSNFFNIFKEELGVTPSEYIKIKG